MRRLIVATLLALVVLLVWAAADVGGEHGAVQPGPAGSAEKATAAPPPLVYVPGTPMPSMSNFAASTFNSDSPQTVMFNDTGIAPRWHTLDEAKAWLLAMTSPREFAFASAIVWYESRWQIDSVNPRSFATGLPQIMPFHQPDPVTCNVPEQGHLWAGGKGAIPVPGDWCAGWRYDPLMQLAWMRNYVALRFGSFEAAYIWEFVAPYCPTPTTCRTGAGWY